MKKLFLSAAVMLSTFSMLIASPSGPAFKTRQFDPNLKTITSDAPEDVTVRKLAPGVTLSVVNGKKNLSILGENSYSTLDVPQAKVQAKASEPKGYVLYESFEGWNGNASWKPSGWSIESKGSAGKSEKWFIAEQGSLNPNSPDGNYFLSITEGYNQDEWYISPYVVPEEGMELTYWLYLDPLFLFVVDSKHVDFITKQWIGSPEIAATLQILAQVEGEEDWVLLRDYVDDYKGWTFQDLYNAHLKNSSSLSKNLIDISDYYGKKMRIAFRYVGSDGGELFIDAIGIGYPTLDNISYDVPACTQYWGFIRSPFAVAFDEPVAIYPAYVPVTWNNSNVEEGIDYTWSCYSEGSEDAITSDDSESFTITYKPEYNAEELPGYSFYSSPVLHADAGEKRIPADYQAPFSILQAGGKPMGMDFEDEEGIYPLDVIPFNAHHLDFDGIIINESNLFGNLGGGSIPVFGYDGANTDQYWLKYQLNGEEQKDGDYVHLIGIGNIVKPVAGAPMVLNGANLLGLGQMGGDVQLTVTVRSIINGKENNFDYTTMDVVASKTITGADVIRQDPSKSLLCIPFDFDEPVILKTSDKDGEIGAYFVSIEGFRSEDVYYFVPWQNKLPDPSGVCLGYTIKHIDLTSHTDGKPYYEIAPMKYMENGHRISLSGAFMIGLLAEYPWLATECETISLPADGSVVEVALDSYYAAAGLTVEAPAGVKTSITGQYDKCVLKASLDTKANAVTGNVVVKGLGVELSIPVSTGAAGINDIISDDAEIKTVYDLTGRRVEAADATPGVYVVKYDNGTTRKLVVK
ncbi:MAG: hypothetical protein K2J12_06960 [Muribaculaceae bacterium]|nr:hypothetical protein [Muribaculaceae bacterium]